MGELILVLSSLMVYCNVLSTPIVYQLQSVQLSMMKKLPLHYQQKGNVYRLKMMTHKNMQRIHSQQLLRMTKLLLHSQLRENV